MITTATSQCPYCYGQMHVRSLRCETCGTEVCGHFALSSLLRLSPEQQEFVIRFVTASGSLKEMAKLLGVSYPTVRGRLDRIIEVLEGGQPPHRQRRAAVLDALEEKRLSPEDAAGLLSSLSEEGGSEDEK